jgi:cellulose synthase/poly-beta-1,6-N-acetylglucosamine synthase-like glycosyltransferase/peptidoglycan/xylan/chitin deacetylase (PgdA/CDA1 family)
MLFVFCLAALVLMLMIQGFSAHMVGASSTGSGNPSGSDPLAHAGPILMAGRGGGLRTVGRNPGKRLAITVDDGPSPDWTPKLLAVLHRNHVPATFFVVGTQAVRSPDIVRAEFRAGDEIGNHTYTHVNPATVPSWARTVQLDLTQSAISGIIGVRPRLFRPPYSSTPSAATPSELKVYRQLVSDGYMVTLATYDSEDWTRPGVAQIVQNIDGGIAQNHGQGGVMMFHDAGAGGRAQTVKALAQLIPDLKRRGYSFVTVSQLAGVPRSAVDVPASSWQGTRGQLLVTALHIAAWVTRVLTIVVLGVGVLTVLRMLALLALARRHARRPRDYDPSFTPPVSIVVPAYNEEIDIGKAVRSLATSDYPELEVVVVDDGSTDRTADVVEGLWEPRVRLVRQANAGKAAALNHGIVEAAHEIVVTVDADTVFEPGTVRQLVQPFRDARVGAVSGNTKVSNRRRLLGRWQHIEYVMGFNLDRRMYEMLDCMPTVPGAIGAFRREALTSVGGFSEATLAEDTDVTMAIGRAGWQVVYEQTAHAYTEAPSTLEGLWRQRYRWAYGTLQSIWKHRDAVRERGPIGRRAIPYLALFQIALPFAAPLIDLFAIYGLLFLDPLPVLAYWLGFNAFQLVLAVYAFRLDRESLKPLWAMPLQQFVYRQVMYLVVFQSAVSAVRGVRLGWQHVARTGDLGVPDVTGALGPTHLDESEQRATDDELVGASERR